MKIKIAREPQSGLHNEFQSNRILSNLTTGVLIGFTEIIFAVSLGSLVFSGDLAPHLPQGISIALASLAITTIFITLTSSVPGIVTGIQENPALIQVVILTGLLGTLTLSSESTRLSTSLAILTLTSFLSGLFFLLLGIFKLGGLVRYVPFPVVGGLLAGTGWLLVQASFDVMTGYPLNISNIPDLFELNQLIIWLPGLVLAFVLVHGLKRVDHIFTVPGIVIGAILLFYVILLVTGTSIDTAISRGLLLITRCKFLMNGIDPEKRTDTQLKTQKQKPKTRAEDFRTLLKTLENRVARLSEITSDQVLEIPSLYDQVDQARDELQALGTNLASEQGQIETISAQFNKKRASFIRRIGGPQVLENRRQEIHPSRDRWWWYVDLSLAADKRSNLIRWLKIIGAVAVLLIILGIIYQQFFAPDPIVRESYGHQQRAENALIGGNLEEALVEVQQAITLTPQDPVLYMMQGVIQDKLGLAEDASASFDTALQEYAQDEQFYNQRTTIYLMLGDAESAIADSESAIQLNPDSAIGYLNRGNAYDLMGDTQKAIESLEKADEIAQKSGNAQLQAIIRISLSSAYQSISFPTPDGTETGVEE